MSEPKRHHLLPRHYQAGFSSDGNGELWVFERRKQRIRSAYPSNTSVENHFYSWASPSDRPSSLESMLAKGIEGPFWPVRDRLDAQQFPDYADRFRLAYFCAFLLVRIPAFRALYEHAFTSGIAAHPRLERDIELINDLFRQSPSGLFLPVTPKNARLRQMVDMAMEVGKHLLTLDIHFMSSYPEEPFITTDNPFVLDRLIDQGQKPSVKADGFLKWIPLSAKTAVGFGEPGDNITWTNVIPPKVHRTNRALAAVATDLVIAGSKEQLSKVVAGLSPMPPHPTCFPSEIKRIII